MIEIFIQYLQTYTSLKEDESEYIRSYIPIRILPKNETVLKAGDVSREFYFVISGCVRLYYLSKGEEKTAFFYTEKMFVSSYESFTRQIGAKHFLQTVEETHVAVISQEVAGKMLERFPRFEFLARMMMEEELIVYQEIISSFITLTPEERYLKLLSEKSDLLSRVPQYQLATYLGVSPETLSRIRKRITLK